MNICYREQSNHSFCYVLTAFIYSEYSSQKQSEWEEKKGGLNFERSLLCTPVPGLWFLFLFYVGCQLLYFIELEV